MMFFKKPFRWQTFIITLIMSIFMTTFLIACGSTGSENRHENIGTYLGVFKSLGGMTTMRYNHTATLLPNGKVLITGGWSNGDTPLSSAELYDPSTGTFVATGSMSTARYDYTTTLLTNGNVLITGGRYNFTDLSSAELYDPVEGIFTSTGSMSAVRVSHTATLLSNGNVLITGGSGSSTPLSCAELYDQ